MRMLLSGMIFIIMIIFIGCSGKQPITPTTQDVTSSGLNPQILVTDWDSNGNPAEGMGLLGAFHVTINLEDLSGELTPIRQNQSQDVLEVVDITNFLTIAPCTDCVKLKSISMDTYNHLDLYIGIKHPFGTPDPSAPITGRNRADLHVFNIEGTIVVKDYGSSIHSFSELNQKVSPIVLINADGYSPYLDGSIDSIMQTDATIHPYILHFDNFSIGNFNPLAPCGFTDVLNPTGNLVMPMGSLMNYQHYLFDFPQGISSFEFIFAIGCTYGISADNRNQRMNPVYRLPQFNKKAATSVWIKEIIEDNLVGFIPGNTSSTETVVVNVLDMNHGYPVGDKLNELRHLSNVDTISIEIPMVCGLKTFPNPIPKPGGNPRDPSNPLVYSFTLANELAAPAGEYYGLVKVLDSYPPNLNERVNGDGIGRVPPGVIPTDALFQIPEFATYAPFKVVVETKNNPPTACFTRMPLGNPQVGVSILLNAGCSTDVDGNNLTYEWDFDYQPNDFQVEEVGAVVYHPYSTPGTRTIALRVTDNGSPQMSDMTTSSITIVPSQALTFGPNQALFGPVAPSHPGESQNILDGCPLGMHYSEAKGFKVCAIVPSGSPSPAPLNLYYVRSDNSGSSFVLPPAIINDTNLPSSASASISLTDTSKADAIWMVPAFPGVVYNDRANVGYGFGTDKVVYNNSYLGVNLSHDTFGDPEIYIAYSHMDISGGFYYRIVLFRSFNNGNTFNETPIDIPYKAGCGTTGHYYAGQINVDANGTIHVAFIAGTSTPNPGQIRYTKSTDKGDTFTPYKPLDTLQGVSSIPGYNALSLDTSPNGQNIYIAYRSKPSTYDNIYLLRSTDGGNNFASPILVDDRNANGCDMPCIVTDDYGWVYISYEDRIDPIESPLISWDYDVRVQRSRDGGLTWDPSIRVNNDAVGNHQVAPTIAVDEAMNLHVFWRDDRDAPNIDYKLYYAKATQL